MRQDSGETFEVESLALLRRVQAHGDQDAWEGFRLRLEETVLTWLRDHPAREAACDRQNEEHFVTQAFEQFRQAAVGGQVSCATLAEVVVFLRASLNGAILETLRVSSRPGAVSEERLSGARYLESREVWDWLLTLLSSEREQQLAYLLYHCGLGPEEIVRCFPKEWSDIQEIQRLRRAIIRAAAAQ